MSNNAKLIHQNNEVELPVYVGTEQEVSLDISKLRATSKLVTIDPGFKNTASCTSEITFLDGEKGILRYRGYSIEDLANNATFLEVCYLLIFGELPNAKELQKFQEDINSEAEMDTRIKDIINVYPKDSHPMGMFSSLTNSFLAFDKEITKDEKNDADFYKTIIKLLGRLPVLAGWILRHSQGKSYTALDTNLEYTENIVNLLFSNGNDTPDPILVSAFNKLLILHADHEQNCSTSTVRIVGSSHASLFSSVSAGISALWGPLHGGANQAVIEMLEAIVADGGDTKKFMAKAKDKNDPFRLMGFGHRVYKNFDPRAKIIKKAADEVLHSLGVTDPALDVAKGLEQEALSDQYFIDRKLYPNVDFYSGIIYKAMGLPMDMFTVLFAVGRLPGWIAQWKEMRANNEPIGRPRQIYTGATLRDYIDISKR